MATHYSLSSIIAFMAVAAVLLLGFSTTIRAARYGSAFTVYNALSVSNFNCLYQYSQTPVIRVYAGAKVDSDGMNNILNAKSAGFKTMEVYVQPDAFSTKPGWQQFDETYQFVKKQFILQRVWLLVTDPRSWTASADANVNFIRSFVQQAVSKGVAVGIYTSWYDWLLITHDYQDLQQYCGNSGCPVWYWHALGQGPNAASGANFDDFRPFGSFKASFVKEYDIVDKSYCGVYVNWSVYSAGNNKQMNDVQNNLTSRKLKAAAKMLSTQQKMDGVDGKTADNDGTDAKMIIGNAF